MKTDAFTWRKEGEKLIRDVYGLDRALADARKRKPLLEGRPVVGHMPVRFARVGQDLRISAYAYVRKKVHAWLPYLLPSAGRVRPIQMAPIRRLRGEFEAAISGNEL